eukprot:1923188-Amphidinium_carterae.1
MRKVDGSGTSIRTSRRYSSYLRTLEDFIIELYETEQSKNTLGRVRCREWFRQVSGLRTLARSLHVLVDLYTSDSV